MDDSLTQNNALEVLQRLSAGELRGMDRIEAVDIADAQRQAEESAQRARIVKALPPGLSAVVLGQLDSLPAVEAVTGWVKTTSRGYVIRGPVGGGKSVAAAVAIAATVRAGKRSVSWHRPNDFVSAILHSYDANAPRVGEDLVVIDDCGRETKADFCEAMCAFLDDTATRFVLTTNMQRDAFRAHYDERLIDRLNHCAKAFTVKGESRRMKGDF